VSVAAQHFRTPALPVSAREAEMKNPTKHKLPVATTVLFRYLLDDDGIANTFLPKLHGADRLALKLVSDDAPSVENLGTHVSELVEIGRDHRDARKALVHYYTMFADQRAHMRTAIAKWWTLMEERQ
jgi:hypothetical protein